MRSIESGGGGGTGWALSCSTAYMVHREEEPRTTPEKDGAVRFIYVFRGTLADAGG